MKASIPKHDWVRVESLLYRHEDAILDIAGARYEWAARIMRAAVEEPKVTRASLTSNLDRVFTHPFWGTASLLLILGAVFWLTYRIGSPIQVGLSEWINQLALGLRAVWPFQAGWVLEFLAGGVLGGLGMILTFLPILVIFFASLGFLEDTGYLARAAFLSDRWMHKMGLHGKSFMPMLLGFGCNVPAVLGTRIIESRRSRLIDHPADSPHPLHCAHGGDHGPCSGVLRSVRVLDLLGVGRIESGDHDPGRTFPSPFRFRK